jgi:F0F1-type ATP synthase membrane subunit a
MQNNKFELIIASPLSQFEINDLLNINILNYINLNITNIGLYLTIGFIFILIISTLATNENKLISNN